MKKRTVSGNETSSRQLHRRQTRSNANSKQTHVEHDQDKRHKVRLADIQESPTKKSPETNSSYRPDNLKEDARFETPKSNRSSYLQDSTPFKDDFLLASQGYDTQCDVRWDCTSPDALRYIRKNRRRHHSSDVADIVQLLIPEEPQKEDAGPSANTPPLLGLWMNSSSQSTLAGKEDTSGRSTFQVHCSKLVRFRKKERARSNASRDVKMPSELLEKLKLAVERCNEGHSETTEMTIENVGETKKEGFDQSKDLFASAEAARSVFRRTDTSPVPQNAKKAECQDGDHDLDWSDDDMFEEDSFLMKATQDPGLESKGTQSDKRGNKRKSHELEESQSKISKVRSSTYQECQSNKTKGEQSKGVIPYKMLQVGKGRSPSPFRKVKSFNDIDQVETKRVSDLRPHKGRKCLSLRNVDNMTKPQTITNPAVRSADARCGSTFSYQATKSTNNSALDKKQLLTQDCPSVENRTGVDTSSPSILKKNVSSTTAATNSSVASGGRNSISTKTGASTLQPGIIEAYSSGPKKTSGKSPIVPVYSTSHSVKGQISISSRTYVVAKPQNTNSCSVGNRQRTATQSPNPAVDKGMANKINSGLHCSGSTVSSTSTATTSRRRSSGMFDTSLSDDLLCQLAEPDELLDSQASPTTYNNLNHKSPSVSTVSLGVKPQQGTTKCVSESCDRPDGTKKQTMTGFKKVPQSSSVNKTRCAGGNKAQTKQPHVISGSESVHVGSGANSVINLSQVPSTQKSKFKFKSKSVSSEMVVPTSVSTVASKVSVSLSTSVSAPELNKLHAAAPKPSGALVDNSEDLFISDEDELSEQQILAMLDTVEMEATQKPPVPDGHRCPETYPSAFPSKCSLNQIEQKKHAARAKLQQKKTGAVSPETQSLNASQTKSSPSKYTQYEIERKKQAALEKRRVKMKETLPESSNVIDTHKQDCELDKQQCVGTKTSSTIPCSSSVSPIKYQQDIERKRLAALEKLKLREEAVNKCASTFSDRNSLSPVKCKQDEIEQKKLAALERQKHASGDVIKVRHQSDSSPGVSSSQSAESSPFKCTPEEIEKKKLAALAKLKIKRNLNSQLSSNKGSHSKT
ncbi:uncharacterized protein LOC110456809 [Mizuhopecten yessoensis]|uniref:Uncharacterized protein n=1 Tax=Mizuhopecten yessoensis TaxID=6573 RepID=A0A210QA76_MIZYE|nr:uncharacterized protein LOC110456809 [Mizuhopecten yessoensis]OWF45609.1 hypothetical protein KP79_PYT01539 [Mizuhopecten yessoensis]